MTVAELPELLTTEELAEFLGVSAETLANERYLKRGFPYIKLGKRVRYRLNDVMAHLDANTVRAGGKNG